MDNVAQIALFGRAQGNRASLNCRQRTRSGELGFDFGLNVLWIDSILTISMFPEHPTLGFKKWSVNEDNRIAYRSGGEIEADLTLTRPGQRFSLRTLPSVDSTLQALTLNIVGIDIGSSARRPVRHKPRSPDPSGRIPDRRYADGRQSYL